MFKMIKESKERDMLKKRVEEWSSVSYAFKNGNRMDMAILETFFYIYYGLMNGEKIQELGNKLGVFPLP